MDLIAVALPARPEKIKLHCVSASEGCEAFVDLFQAADWNALDTY